MPLTHRHHVEFRAGQEHEERQTEVRERSDDRVRVRQPEHRGPEHDAEQDQDHDFGNGYESPQRLRGERREHGGPAVETPTRRGFGMRVIEASFRDQLGGHVQTSFESPGFACAVDVPLATLRGAAESLARETAVT